jgi:activator of 2-hydroxyglutaryl-CoA dehydratase/predicted nucleotide-binding protein (sugar kinase/HSP70/actin superfamily)
VTPRAKGPARFAGLDIGAETVRLVVLERHEGALSWTGRAEVEHHKDPGATLAALLAAHDWPGIAGAAVTGRFSRQLALPRLPVQQARAGGARHLAGTREPLTVVSIGSHGFSVLECRGEGLDVLRENSRCSQGTGSFLRQLVERFDLSIETASALVEAVDDPAPLSGRCPVILKTDMTHLANRGESRPSILAGLYDAVCENVQVLIKPGVCPPRLLLTGGVSRARRVRDRFRAFADRHGLELFDVRADDALYVDALGCALAAADHPAPPPPADRLYRAAPPATLERVAPLADSLARVRRLTAPPAADLGARPRRGVAGLDIGSTGSKLVVLDADTRETLWQGYTATSGDPVGAMRALVGELVRSPVGGVPVIGFGCTGSGREIVGSLLRTCYGHEPVFVMNEIAAHAAGAVHHDPRVDTIFEIGGQDAKYIRLAGGRVIDAAMNEACSAGTGSFIAEQGGRFAGRPDVHQLADEALAAPYGVSLGQHCSVFMAEVIDEAAAAGEARAAIIAGLYDSVIQNYLNRVKGSRTVGQVIFCQGMPFSASALAAAVARQTGAEVIVPPHPGTIGALGIALLTLEEGLDAGATGVDLGLVLDARIERKDDFVCASSRGCGGAGNRCRIDRITTLVAGERQRFTWGGACSLYDRGARGGKLPDRAPDPFRARDELIAALARSEGAAPPGAPRVAVTDEFLLKELFPFFVTLLRGLGAEPVVVTGAGRAALKRGIARANVPFCAPMQQFHGLVDDLLDGEPDAILLPRLRSVPRAGVEQHATTCPISQGSPELLRADLAARTDVRLLTPLIEFGPDSWDSQELLASCQRFADELGVTRRRVGPALAHARAVQQEFDEACIQLGRDALEFCREHDITPVVVLGRAYTILNTVLNSNVPALLRELGALPIPVGCYPVDASTPVIEEIYWGYAQRNLRAAYQLRRETGVYSVFCSNYSCGPDSFSGHFYAYIMEGKPFAVIETDGHSGDAGTKTRLEAFLHCVRQDRASADEKASPPATPTDIVELFRESSDTARMRARAETVLLPHLSDSCAALAACLRGLGFRAVKMPVPDHAALREGRRHTSGKECLPMALTLGSVLRWLDEHGTDDAPVSLLMPTTYGPCRFGCYNLLDRIIAERLCLRGRLRVWSPADRDYFRDGGSGFAGIAMAAITASDALIAALHHVRPVEREPGLAQRLYERYHAELVEVAEREARQQISAARTIREVTSRRLYGLAGLLARAAGDFRTAARAAEMPTVLLVGEIYVRLDPFACDRLVERLEERGLRVRRAPASEWFEYTSGLALRRGDKRGFGPWLSNRLSLSIQQQCHDVMARALGWPPRTTVEEVLSAAEDYIRPELWGEAVLTVGGPVQEWREGLIDGAVSVGPLECMPSKLAESQFFHVAEREGLKALTLSLNGEPIDPEVLDNLAHEVHERFERRRARTGPAPVPAAPPRRWPVRLPAAEAGGS